MNKIVFSAAAAFLICVMAVIYGDSIQSDAAEHMVRLHILANSDSTYDQNVKLELRDDFIEKFGGQENLTSPEVLQEMEEEANRFLQERGEAYSAKVCSGVFSFPEKQYEDITLPAGSYCGVKVLLGNGEGQNWWCVMDPPMCFTKSAVGNLDEEGQAVLEDRLHQETYRVIKGENVEYRYKLKVVEWVKNILN